MTRKLKYEEITEVAQGHRPTAKTWNRVRLMLDLRFPNTILTTTKIIVILTIQYDMPLV